jgi:hypothetical protein
MDYAKSLHPSPCHFPLETLINTGDSEGKVNGEGFLRISIFLSNTWIADVLSLYAFGIDLIPN